MAKRESPAPESLTVGQAIGRVALSGLILTALGLGSFMLKDFYDWLKKPASTEEM